MSSAAWYGAFAAAVAAASGIEQRTWRDWTQWRTCWSVCRDGLEVARFAIPDEVATRLPHDALRDIYRRIEETLTALYEPILDELVAGYFPS